MSKVNRKFKDTIFTKLFGENKENFLSLYNAINQTDLKPEDTIIQRKIIPQTVYHTYNNDISMLVNNKLIVMIEHQSTINENIPFRFLEYVIRIYETIVDSDDRYKKRMIPLPRPEFYVFYNGMEKYQNDQELFLSNAFEGDSEKINLELRVVVKNITFSNNPQSNLKIIEACTILKEYCQFIELVRKNGASKRGFKRAIETAIDNNILRVFFIDNSREVINMLCARYSYKRELKVLKKEAREEGFEEGLQEGLQKGLQKGVEKGVKEEKKSIALAMLQANESVDKIIKYTGFTEKEILDLQ